MTQTMICASVSEASFKPSFTSLTQRHSYSMTCLLIAFVAVSKVQVVSFILSNDIIKLEENSCEVNLISVELSLSHSRS